MVRLVMILLGVDYLRTRWKSVMTIGVLSIVLGCVIFSDALDGALYFPITPFALLMLLEGLATLAVAWTGMGGQRTLHYVNVKGVTFCLSALLVLIGVEHGNFALSMIFGTLFLVDGALQIIAAKVDATGAGSLRWRAACWRSPSPSPFSFISRIRTITRERSRTAWRSACSSAARHDPARTAHAAHGVQSRGGRRRYAVPFLRCHFRKPARTARNRADGACVDAGRIGEGRSAAAADRRSIHCSGRQTRRDIDGTCGAGNA